MADVKSRRAVEWQRENPVLRLGEPGYDRTSGRLKIGNGRSRWNELTYVTGSSSSSSFSEVDAELPTGAVRVYATEDQAVADANPEYVWLILDPSGGEETPPPTDGEETPPPTDGEETPPPDTPSGVPTLISSVTTITPTGWQPTRAVTLPTGIQAGDVLVMVLHGNLEPVYGITPPAGWTDRAQGTDNTQDIRMFTATATGTEGTTVSLGVENAPEQTGTIVYQLRNVAETPAAIAKNSGFVVSLDVPTLTGVDTDAIVLTGFGESSDYDGVDPVIGPGAGWTIDGNLVHARQEIFAHRTGIGTGSFASTNGGKFRAVAAAFQ